MDLLQKRILLTGASGLVGRHLLKELRSRGAANLLTPRSIACDFRNPKDVFEFFDKNRPQVVFSLAAKVGGILDNKLAPAEFYYDNILIGTHTYEACARYGVEKLVSVGAGCGYPLALEEPLREEDFFNGLPQPESMAYSMAKKMLVVQGIAYRQQHGLKSVTLIPSNLYGEHDNFDLTRAHVIPALIRKFYEAARKGLSHVEVWGDGSARRDFLHCSDFAHALVEAALSYDSAAPLNVAYGRQHSIREVVKILTELSGFAGEVVWDPGKPSGESSRDMSLVNLHSRLPTVKPEIDLQAGLARVFAWFAKNYDTARL